MTAAPYNGPERRRTPEEVCRSKGQHSSKARARAAGRYIMSTKSDLQLFVYQCKVCDQWHLTKANVPGGPSAAADYTPKVRVFPGATQRPKVGPPPPLFGRRRSTDVKILKLAEEALLEELEDGTDGP